MWPLTLTLGLILLGALGVDAIASRTGVPRVSLLLIFGLGLGTSGLDLLPDESGSWFATTTDIALSMVGFLLGAEFEWSYLRSRGARIVSLSLGLTVGTAAVVALALRFLAGLPVEIALLLGAIATATYPAATTAVIDECRAEGSMATAIRGIVALDDVWGLLVFSVASTTALALRHGGVELAGIAEAAAELGLSIGFGALLGAVSAPLTARLTPGKPTQLEALGLVLVCAGAARWLGLSPLLASVAMGTAMVNLARHHVHPFRDIEDVEWPFLVIFFVLAGASFDVSALAGLGMVAGVYAVARLVGRYVGIALGALPIRSLDRPTLVWLPTALLPQAGVALGLALSAAAHFPEDAADILTVTVAGTLLFELVGPTLTRIALFQVGEAAPPGGRLPP